jgi:hypothetical protein
MTLGLGLKVASAASLRRVEQTEVNAVDEYLPLARPGVPGDTDETRLVVRLRRSVLPLLGRRSLSQVARPVVRTLSIAMIDLLFRPANLS